MGDKTVRAKCVFLTVFILSVVFRANATSWYVDPNAAGSNNGTNWANAWTALSSVSWGSIVAGDSLYLSGGSSSQTYSISSTFIIGSAGTSGNQVTIATGCASPSPTGHSGMVILDGGGALISGGMVNNTNGYVTINGFCSGASSGGPIPGINLKMQNQQLSPGESVFINGSGGGFGSYTSGVHITYVEFSGVGDGIIQKFFIASEIDHSYFHNISCDAAIDVVGSLAVATPQDMSMFNYYGLGWTIDHNVIQVNTDGTGDGNGPDATQNTHGADIFGNTIYQATGTLCSVPNHQDAVQKGGAFYRVYQNKIYGMSNSVVQEEEGDIVSGYLQFYDNDVSQLNSNYAASHGIELITSYSGTGSERDIYIQNNTFVDFVSFPALRVGIGNSGTITFGPNFDVQNNIYFNSGWYSLEVPGTQCSGTNFTIDHNNYNVGSLSSGETNCPSGTNDPSLATNTQTGAPTFTSYTVYSPATNNLQITSGSTPNINNGLNLSTSFTVDYLGNMRPSSGSWDTGAYLPSGSPPPATTTAPCPACFASVPAPPTDLMARVVAVGQ